MGMLAALLEAARSGQGQVVAAAIVDGDTSLVTTHGNLPPASGVRGAG
jgi:crotonobetainyl-CoA:carnitine CoA-transferase CaiB-like acyl-CoA transferase